MDALLQVPVDGFRFETGASGSRCKPRNNLDSAATNRFTCLNESESQNTSSPADSTVCSDDHPVFKYINDMLMEEDLEEQSSMLEDSLALQTAERSFFDVLHDQTPISGEQEDDGNFSSITSVHQPSSDFTEIANSNEVSTRRYRNRYDDEEDDLESGRRSKLPAISTVDELAEKFEEVLLVCQTNNQQEAIPNKTGRAKSSSNRTKQQIITEQPVDMRNLLMQCAQAVASFDQSRAAEKLKEIREHSSSHGDATQRLGYHFAEALEARITGIMTTPISATSSRTSMADILKAYKGNNAPHH
ncbi:unnamed protein product [Microthlaspi erraticum]|uniref:Uncharacterized protein n=1 Tax=Microthlaspi erraticum TaxID=1685480 RepID=A0A6D2J9R0_9BRAS|nr:unnamed protein product [Microthlaspi erraticum]